MRAAARHLQGTAAMRTLSLPFISLLFSLLLGASCAGDDVDPEDRERKTKAKKQDTFSCHVIEVFDDNQLEEGLGSVYDFDDDGFFGSDGDSVGVSLSTSELSQIPSGLILDIGQKSFGLHSSKDVVRRIEQVPPSGVTAIKAWEARAEGETTTFELRIFEGNQIGFVYFREDGAAQKTRLASIDCRGLAAPKVL
jgi:hypothetical protein